MAFVSIKRFLAQPDSESATTYLNAIGTLLDGVAAHALELDRAACAKFRALIGQIRAGMSAAAGAESLTARAASAVDAIGEYARDTAGLIHTQAAEMRNMIAMLASTVVDIGGVGERAVARLQKIGDELERAGDMEDVVTLKKKLQSCLGEIRQEARQQRSESAQMVQALRREIARKQDAGPIVGLDLITDLPGESAAQAQFQAAIRSADRKHVAVFVLPSARRINLRFGRATGDEVVRALKQYLREQLAPSDHLFRWPGPAVVALLAGTDSYDKICMRLNGFLETPVDRTFDVGGKSVLIPLAISWSVFALSGAVADVNREIHDFIASQGLEVEEAISAPVGV